MNIETANRLYEYRRQSQLSQEELAEKIGVSRQAVSKWERGEASPDTDNLIMLAKVYGVSLDELVNGKPCADPSDGKDSGAPNGENTSDGAESDAASAQAAEESAQPDEPNADSVSFKDGIHIRSKDGDKVDIGLGGIHVHSKGGDKVHVGWDGIHVNDEKANCNVSVDKNGVNVTEDGENIVFTDNDGHIFVNKNAQKKKPIYRFFTKFPYPIVCAIIYLLGGFFGFCGGWAIGWLIFLTIPLYYTLIDAIFKRNPMHFAYPVLVVLVYLYLGMTAALWHPMWVLFLTIPIYYFICDFLKKLYKNL